MPGIARDDSEDFAGGALIEGSPNVFVEGRPVVRVGDLVAGHGLPPHNSPVMAAGSPNVFTNSIETCREGDPATCGHPATGSFTVYAN